MSFAHNSTFKEDRSFDLSITRNLAAMVPSFFAAKAEREPFFFETNNETISFKIYAGPYGRPTVFDKDILSFIKSRYKAKKDTQASPKYEVSFLLEELVEFLATRKRRVALAEIREALSRLKGTLIVAHVDNMPKEENCFGRKGKGFPIITEWRLERCIKERDRIFISITISKWLHNLLMHREVFF